MSHVRYLLKNRRGNGVRLACTCGQSHGAHSWPSFKAAMDSGEFDRSKTLWVNNQDVSRLCRDYAERGTGYETLRALLKI